MRKANELKETALKETVITRVRFSEVDSMAVVWHGNYIHFFEDAREAFGKKYGLGYMDIYGNGYVTPLVSINCEYKRPLRYGDEARIEITMMKTLAAKIIFSYKIYNNDTNILVATGESTQVFLSVADNSLCLVSPLFFEQWKERVNYAQ